MYIDENTKEKKYETKTPMEAFGEGFAHPIMWDSYIDQYEWAAMIGSYARGFLVMMGLLSMLSVWVINKLADDGKLALYDDDKKKWSLWDKVTKSWSNDIKN